MMQYLFYGIGIEQPNSLQYCLFCMPRLPDVFFFWQRSACILFTHQVVQALGSNATLPNNRTPGNPGLGIITVAIKVMVADGADQLWIKKDPPI
jgi:hypothetical protein